MIQLQKKLKLRAKMRLNTAKFTRSIEICAKSTRFFNNGKLLGNLRDRGIK